MVDDGSPRGRGIPRNLSRERIVEAALTLVREGGVAGLSMRRLAAELDATVAVTYHYFPNKSAVVEAVSEVVVDQIIAADDAGRPWRDRLLRLMLAQDRELLRHPGIARFLVENHDRRAATRWSETYLRVLLDGGFSPALRGQHRTARGRPARPGRVSGDSRGATAPGRPVVLRAVRAGRAHPGRGTTA